MTPISRALLPTLLDLGRQVPAVVLTGPRQSGKTTLCRMAWPDYAYVNLERPDHRAFATDDPAAFLRQYRSGVVIDEVQRAPELTSWLQVAIDEDPTPGRWILTGSEQLSITERTSQSLAGRSAYAHLLPFDVSELATAGLLPASADAIPWLQAVLQGGYPATYSRPVDRSTWLANYVQTYVERDVRQLLGVSDLGRFQDLLALLGANAGQLLNLSRLGGGIGVSHPTVRSWISVLEASFIVTQLRPWHRNLGKRVIKTPRLYFWDTGLLCNQLRIETTDHLFGHPLRGALFENWVIVELLKMLHHRGERPDMWFYRDQSGLEVDLLLRRTDRWLAIEIKSGTTVARDAAAGLKRFDTLAGGTIDGLPIDRAVVYGGDEAGGVAGAELVPWHGLAGLI